MDEIWNQMRVVGSEIWALVCRVRFELWYPVRRGCFWVKYLSGIEVQVKVLRSGGSFKQRVAKMRRDQKVCVFCGRSFDWGYPKSPYAWAGSVGFSCGCP